MRRRYQALALLLMAAAAVAGCLIDPDDGPKRGREIQFNAYAKASNRTRTSYEGTVNTVGADMVERINWVGGSANPDRITVYCHETAEKSSDYVITTVTEKSETESSAKLTPATGMGLRWSDATTYTFVGLYPAAALMDGDGSQFSITSSQARWKIPALQAVTKRDGTNSFYPDMHYAAMVARTEASLTTPVVNLEFHPAFSAFEISFDRGVNDVLHITSLSLTTSSEGAALAGIVNASAETDETYPLDASKWTVSAGGSATVTAYFSSLENGKLVLDAENPSATVTLLALPVTMTQLTISITADEIGSKILQLRYNNGNWVSFAPCGKIRITGLSLPATEDLTGIGGNIHWNGTVGEELYWHGAIGEDISWKN